MELTERQILLLSSVVLILSIYWYAYYLTNCMEKLIWFVCVLMSFLLLPLIRSTLLSVNSRLCAAFILLLRSVLRISDRRMEMDWDIRDQKHIWKLFTKCTLHFLCFNIILFCVGDILASCTWLSTILIW